VARAKALSSAGLKVWIDPGIGFGKTLSHNISLIRHLDRLVATGYPVLLGVSRKTLIGKILGTVENPAPVEDRIEGSLAMEAFAQLHGVSMVRVHDVRAARRVATVIDVLHG
jgi:dihydropteroate synthase